MSPPSKKISPANVRIRGRATEILGLFSRDLRLESEEDTIDEALGVLEKLANECSDEDLLRVFETSDRGVARAQVAILKLARELDR